MPVYCTPSSVRVSIVPEPTPNTVAAAPVTLAELIVPAPGRIVVQVDVKEETFGGGLYIPRDLARSVHETRPTQGIVVAIGSTVQPLYEDEDDDLRNPPNFVELGDRVVFGKYTGVPIDWAPQGSKGPQYKAVIMDASSVLAKLRTPDQARGLRVRT